MPVSAAAALERAAAAGPYFRLGHGGAAPRGSHPVAGLYRPGPVLDGVLSELRGRLGGAERRVVAATFQFGHAARLWSVVLGAVVRGGVLPDLDPARLHHGGDPATLHLAGEVGAVTLPGEAGGDTADRGDGGRGDDVVPVGCAGVAEVLVREVLGRHLDPLGEALQADWPVARGLLRGNAASAVAGAARVLGDPAAHRLAAEVLARPQLGGTLRGGRRRSCCLFYRTPVGGTCGDCPLTGRPVVS